MDIVYILIVIGVILFSMTLHEAMHGFVGYWLGDNTAKLQGRLTLNPLKHIDPFLTLILPILLAIAGLPIFGGAKPVPFNPHNVRFGDWGAALIAFAGPMTNFIISFVMFGIWVVAGLPAADTTGGLILATFVWVNLGFFVFNMLPIPPLDGSRVIYAIAPDFIKKGMQSIERYGIIFIFVIVLLAGSLLGRFMLETISSTIQAFEFIYRV